MITTPFQKLVNHLYRYPKAYLEKVFKYGGPVLYYRMIRAKGIMMNASEMLPAVKSYDEGYPVYFLTGKNLFYQTLFCISSLTRCTNEKFKFVIIDDGSFDDEVIAKIRLKVIGVVIITREQIDKNLRQFLPSNIFPVISKKREIFVLLKKITDVHTVPSDEWKLFLDSDMLFLKEPVEMIGWLKNPDQYLYLEDFKQSYGYTQNLMERLCGTSIPHKLNSGITGVKSSAIDWQLIERWISELEESENSTYLLEQALTAMLIGESMALVLTKPEYIVNPSPAEIVSKKGVLHHYVDFSKRDYLINAWKFLFL